MKNKKTVIIHIDALRREYLSGWLLGEFFKKKGYNVLLTSRHTTRRILKYFTPDIFVSTHVFLLTPKFWKNLIDRGTKVYINEVEGTDHIHGVKTTYPETYCNEKINYSLFSGIFVWGDYSYNFLIKNRNLDNDKVFLNGSTRQSILSRPERKKDKVVVGIISRFEIINTFDQRHPFDNLSVVDPEDSEWKWYFDRCVIDSEAFSIAYKLIKKLVEKGNYISIRAHPNECIDPYKLLKKKFGKFLEIDNSYNINEWLSKVSVVVGTSSTAFTEPYLAKIPIITFSKIQNFHYSGVDQKNWIHKFDLSAYQPKSVDEMFNLCIKLDLKEKSSKELDKYFNSFYSLKNTIDPIEKIVQVVNSDVDNKSSSINYVIAKLFLFSLDILFIIKNTITNSKGIDVMKNYNYNRLLHKPSPFMKNILKKNI